MIDKYFIENWATKYVYSSKFSYSDILTLVQEEINSKKKNLSIETFEKIVLFSFLLFIL